MLPCLARSVRGPRRGRAATCVPAANDYARRLHRDASLPLADYKRTNR